jgi:hypothetical protein
MTDPYADFRINFEQQQKRAKELVKSAKAGEAEALQRLQRAGFQEEPKLAQAQHCIARELRFANWAALKQQCETMSQTRESLGIDLDADLRTMHIRCGSDFLRELREAGFHGDFNLHINPYLEGPVLNRPDWLELRAQFVANSLGPYMPELKYERVLEDFRLEEARLGDGARNYERVVLWLEHDRYDQFVLLRCLAYFAEHGAPPRLELVTANDFPGSARFVGLGQLPPEALKLLWERRRPISAEQLAFARHAWDLFRRPDPRQLAELARSGTPLLPDLAAALFRHLEELPGLHDSLGLTHRLLLQVMADKGKRTAGSIVGTAMRRDPLPGLGDLSYEHMLREMERLSEPLLVRSGAHPLRQWHLDEVEIAETGRALLEGKRNWFELGPPPRWVGATRVMPGPYNWCWDYPQRDAVVTKAWSVHQPNKGDGRLRIRSGHERPDGDQA